MHLVYAPEHVGAVLQQHLIGRELKVRPRSKMTGQGGADSKQRVKKTSHLDLGPSAPAGFGSHGGSGCCCCSLEYCLGYTCISGLVALLVLVVELQVQSTAAEAGDDTTSALFAGWLAGITAPQRLGLWRAAYDAANVPLVTPPSCCAVPVLPASASHTMPYPMSDSWLLPRTASWPGADPNAGTKPRACDLSMTMQACDMLAGSRSRMNCILVSFDGGVSDLVPIDQSRTGDQNTGKLLQPGQQMHTPGLCAMALLPSAAN